MPPEMPDQGLDVLHWIALGYSNLEIANETKLTRRATDRLVLQVISALQARNRTHAAVIGVRDGLVSGRAADDPEYPDEQAVAAIADACTCAGCMTGGRCVEDGPDDSECDDDRNDCRVCPDDCLICSSTPDCGCPTHGDECDG